VVVVVGGTRVKNVMEFSVLSIRSSLCFKLDGKLNVLQNLKGTMQNTKSGTLRLTPVLSESLRDPKPFHNPEKFGPAVIGRHRTFYFQESHLGANEVFIIDGKILDCCAY
jgi:hypothetical protein